MNEERMLKVLIAPHISEKSSMVAEQSNQVIFK
ncbi:MAG: 50S ribosomal protein L23, partial [Gammaproteobacteria bacterium]|nr:50S ribosomal protein L23 [Gammaproteobacteria bacterium]